MELTRRSFACAALLVIGSVPLGALASESRDASSSSKAGEGDALATNPGSLQAAADLMSAIDGTYECLFDVLAQYPDVWREKCASIVGDEDAKATAEALQASCMGTLVGQEAVDAYASDPDAMAFDCSLPDGVARLTIEDGVVSGVDQVGAEVFSHTYEYLCYAPELDFYVFKTTEEDAGEFTYFLSRSDNPADTYHLEMRFGSDLDELLQFTTGAYAYAMPSAISVDADEQTIESCIELFVTENLEA